MRPFQLFACIVGRHHRSRRDASYDSEGVLRSRCSGCGKPMVKEFARWRVAE